jgi:hypothetical protein
MDWSSVERDARRSAVWAIVGFAAFFASLVPLTGGFAFWEGRAAWIAVGLFVAVGIVVQLVVILRSRTSERAARNLRFRYALLHRVDPGPGVREKVDLAARQLSTVGWLWWVFPLTPVSFLLQGRLDRPLVALPAAVVLVGAVVAFVLWWQRSAAAARRWVADPPGPHRAVPPPSRRERWVSGRRLVWVLVAVFALAVLGSLVLVLLPGD